MATSFTIGPRVAMVAVAAIAALVIIVAVVFDADEVAIRAIDAVFGGDTPRGE